MRRIFGIADVGADVGGGGVKCYATSISKLKKI